MLCIKVAGEKKHAVVEALSKFPIALSGLFLFGNGVDKVGVVTADGVEAIVVGCAGAVLFVWAKAKQSVGERRESLLPSSVVRAVVDQGSSKDYL